ncbi:MAG: TIGR01212 family radical SAM protein [Elusimicrobia bacterium]|nr:TIGR01212 family radical SAM protein [Elusimicrobiota bacterium]
MYYKFSDYFKKQGFGTKVYKVTVDAGFSCPNIDGTISDKGCIFCNNKSFSAATRQKEISIENQIEQGIKALNKRYKADKFIVYFQAFTNTYGPIERLKETYEKIKQFNNVIGISIGTRPDCVDENIIKLIGSYADNYEVWIEYGLQSVNNETLRNINRGHSFEDFIKALDLTRKNKKIKICAHVIIGLPGEKKKDLINTAKEVGRLKLEGIKIHPLHVVKETELEKLYNDGTFKPLGLKEYVDLASNFLEYLWPETVVQRITADCPRDLLIAPEWINNKTLVLREIDKTLIEKNTFQGRLFNK